MGTHGRHRWAALMGGTDGYLWAALMGGTDGYLWVAQVGTVHGWALWGGTDFPSQCPFVGTDWHLFSYFLMLFVFLFYIFFVFAHPGGPGWASLVVQCGDPRGGCADKQSARTPPVRRAADRLSYTRVCKTRVRKSHRWLFLFTS